MSEQTALGAGARGIEIGAGPVGFLLVHGLGGTPVELRFVAEGLARAGNAVSVPLLDGHGGSDEVLNDTRWQDWYASVEEACQGLLERCDAIVAGGLSAGAMLALHLAHERPGDVQGTVLFSPTMWPNGWAIPWYFNLFRVIPWKWLANLLHVREVHPYGIKDERIRKFVLESLQNGPERRSMDDIFGRRGGTILEFEWLVGTVRKELRGIRQPALIFHSRDDDQTDLSNTIKLQRALAGRVHTIVLEDSYHMVTLDRQRAVVVERTVEFADWLRRQQPERRPRAQSASR